MRVSSWRRMVKWTALAAMVPVVASCAAGAGTGAGTVNAGTSSLPGGAADAGGAGSVEAAVQCNNVQAPAEPNLMAWDAASRASLGKLRSNGLLVVHYEANGCDVRLELLPQCNAEGTYRYSPYSANESSVASNARDLFVQLPIGAASLAPKVAGDGAVRTDSMVTGAAAVPAGTTVHAADLRGTGCERGTHVIAAMYLGGFALSAGSERQIEASGNRFAASSSPASASSSSPAMSGSSAAASSASTAPLQLLATEGNADACRRAQTSGAEDAACDVPLRVALLRIAADGGGAGGTGGVGAAGTAANVRAITGATAPRSSVAAPTVAPSTVCLPPHGPSVPPAAAVPAIGVDTGDRDGDGIANAMDACPDDAGPRDADPKITGCPQVFLRGANLVVLHPPTFETGSAKLAPESADVLTAVANVVKRHLDIQHLAIEVYTAPSADPGLSQRRANAVRSWLRSHGGIDRSRLDAVGKGSCDPTDSTVTEQGRTDFHIVGLQAR